jgi:hypothetical protein
MAALVNLPVEVVQTILDQVKATDETHFMRALRSSVPVETKTKTKKTARVPLTTREAQTKALMEAYIAQRYNISIKLKPDPKRRQSKVYAFECDVPISATQKQRLVGELLVEYNFRGNKLTLKIQFQPVQILDSYYSELTLIGELMGEKPGFTFYIQSTTPGVVRNGLNMHLFRGLMWALYFTILQTSWMKEGKIPAESYVQEYLKNNATPAVEIDFGEWNGRSVMENKITIDARTLAQGRTALLDPTEEEKQKQELAWFDAAGNILPVGRSEKEMTDKGFLFPVSVDYKSTIYQKHGAAYRKRDPKDEEIHFRKIRLHALSLLYKNQKLEITVWFKTTPEAYKMDVRRFTPTTLNLITRVVHYNLWKQYYRVDGPDAIQPNLGAVEFTLKPQFENRGRIVVD